MNPYANCGLTPEEKIGGRVGGLSRATKGYKDQRAKKGGLAFKEWLNPRTHAFGPAGIISAHLS